MRCDEPCYDSTTTLGPPYRSVKRTPHWQLYILTRRNNKDPEGAAWYPFRYFTIVRRRIESSVPGDYDTPPLTVKALLLEQMSHSFHLTLSMCHGLSLDVVVRTSDGLFRTTADHHRSAVARRRDLAECYPVLVPDVRCILEHGLEASRYGVDDLSPSPLAFRNYCLLHSLDVHRLCSRTRTRPVVILLLHTVPSHHCVARCRGSGIPPLECLRRRILWHMTTSMGSRRGRFKTPLLNVFWFALDPQRGCKDSVVTVIHTPIKTIAPSGMGIPRPMKKAH